MAKKEAQNYARDHILIPTHSKLTVQQKKELLDEYNIDLTNIPKIKISDPGILHLNVKEGDVIKIERKSPTVGQAVYYRGVIND
ncbi:DNA-directed RNA polymerase subunit H [Candidatus Woesearchaeota archaeon]|nr:DNA-directed RNA polymerase subunit H [Candidatus Woesearchaeota archaeon]